MKLNNNPIQMLKNIFSIAIILGLFQAPLQAQDTPTPAREPDAVPSLWFGLATGGNVNFYRGSTQKLNSEFTSPGVFHNGTGTGIYLAPLIEFHPANSRFGAMLQTGFDSRKGTFDDIVTPCNCPANLQVTLNYITVEPSLRIAPTKGELYFYLGPRIAFNMDKSFLYQQGRNPQFPEQAPAADVSGDLSDVKSTVVSMQFGAGYDLRITSPGKNTQMVLNPFVSFHPYFGQARTIETWNTTTLRAGAALRFGRTRNSSPKI